MSRKIPADPVQGLLCRSLRADRPGTLTLHDLMIADRDTDRKAAAQGIMASSRCTA